MQEGNEQEETMPTKRTRSLSFVVAAWTAVAIAISMGAYAVFEYFTVPGMTVGALALHHLWHVVVLGVVIYALCRAIVQQIVVRPLEQIHAHLYGLGMGRLEPLALETNVREIQSIVDHVNLMLGRMEQGFDKGAVTTCQENLKALRKLAADGRTGDRTGEGAVMLQHLSDLEEAVFSIMRDGGAPGFSRLKRDLTR